MSNKIAWNEQELNKCNAKLIFTSEYKINVTTDRIESKANKRNSIINPWH